MATWNQVALEGTGEGAGWPTWLAMRRAGPAVDVRYSGEPLAAEDFAVRVTLHTRRPLQAATVMEAIVDGVIASFQREDDARRAEHVAEALRHKPRLTNIPSDELVHAQMAAPA